jgi:hypothetical protein
MGPFRKKQDKAVMDNPTDQNLSLYKYLKEAFGLQRIKEGWIFEGLAIDIAESDPAFYLDTLKGIQAGLPFNQICVLPGETATIYINSKPTPFIWSELDRNGVTNLIASVEGESGNPIVQFDGLFLIELE